MNKANILHFAIVTTGILFSLSLFLNCYSQVNTNVKNIVYLDIGIILPGVRVH